MLFNVTFYFYFYFVTPLFNYINKLNKLLFFFMVNFFLYQWMPYIILIFKTLFICIFAIAVRGTLPRYRFDQATQLNWKHFIYIWFVFIVLNLTYLIIFF